jgi:hypothetical protein
LLTCELRKKDHVKRHLILGKATNNSLKLSEQGL